MKIYTDEMLQFIEQQYKQKAIKAFLPEFNQRFGLNKTAGQIKSVIARFGFQSGRTGCFGKDSIPWNKGKTGYMGANRTSFKKGNIPKNHRPVGSERLDFDGYVMMKIAEPNKWQLKHRYIYEQAHGAIPEKAIIRFKDSNKYNFDVDNLVLVTLQENFSLTHKFKFEQAHPQHKDTLLLMTKLDCKAGELSQ